MRTIYKDVRVAHLCSGSGFGASGFLEGDARVGHLQARFRNIGGIDNDPAAVADFERFAKCKGTLMDLMSLEQYISYHGKEPPPGWRQAQTTDLHRAYGHERPHIFFISAPCKGFSGLLSEKVSRALKYQALNDLTLRCVWLALEAYKDDPVELFVFENVPRIQTRGRHLIDQIIALFEAYGYAVAETTHDCGELGGLAQSRKRFLLVARHMEKVPPFLYEPPKRPLRGVGEVLERLPMPSTETIGGMHKLPSLQWKTWVRLAFVEAGSDWRSLNKLKVKDGVLADYGIVPTSPSIGHIDVADPRPADANWQKSVLGVREWDKPSGTITSRGLPATGAFSVADPRTPGARENQQYGVRQWDETSGAVINVKSPGQGAYSVADPRPGKPSNELHGKFHVTPFDEPSRAVIGGRENGAYVVSDPRTGYSDKAHQNIFRVVKFEKPTGTVTSANHVTGGAPSVADPRASGSFAGSGKYRVTPFDEPANTVIGGSTTGQGAFSVADPRAFKDSKSTYKTQGHYGVMKWDEPSYAVPGYAKYDRGSWSVADPRLTFETSNEVEKVIMPAPDQKMVAHIEALDGTWHRPFTTLELAALQSLFDPDDYADFEMYGKSDSAWRERIGNAVPPAAAKAIAGVMGRTLLLAWTGETFMLSTDPIWVQPLTIALSVDTDQMIGDTA